MPFIQVETETEIAKVTLDHPSGNRINFAMREELLQAFERVADSKARVLVDLKWTSFADLIAQRS